MITLLALAIFINYVDRGNLATAAPLIKGEFTLSNTQIGTLISAFFWSYVPGQLLAGWLVAKINAYRALTIGLIVWSAATFLMGFASGFGALLILRILLGVGESAGFPASSKLLAQHLPPQRLGSANAFLSAGIMLGPAGGVFFGGLLMAHAGWRVLFVVFGIGSLLWLVPWLIHTSKVPREVRGGQTEDEPSFRALMARRELWAASLGHFANNYGGYLILSWLPLYLVKTQGLSLAEMASLGGLIYVLSAINSLIAGWVADRWMSAGASSNRVRKSMIGSSCFITVLCMLLCAFGSSEAAIAGLLLSSVAHGLGSFNIYAIGQTLAGTTAAGKWVGLQGCIGNLAGIAAPIVTGLIVDATGQFRLAFVLAAFVASMGLICWTLGIPRIEPIHWSCVTPRSRIITVAGRGGVPHQ